MGLFDGYNFNPSNYGGGGVLPPWLAQAIGGLQQGGSPMLSGMPQGRFPPAYPTGSPLGSGAYPQGDAPQGQAAMPPAAPAAQPMPQAPMPQGMPAPALGIGDRLNAGLMGFANSRGLLPAIGNLVSGVTTGQRSDPQGMMQQQQAATYQALRQAGVPHGEAVATALNPEVLKTIARSHFDAKPTFETIGHDQHGQPTYGFVDASRKSVTPYQSPNIASLNTVVGHLGNLMEASNRLDNNGDASLRSQTIKETKSAVKSPVDGSAARNFELARNAVADEMAKVFRAGGLSDEEIRSWQDSLSTSNSPMGLRVVIGRSIELMSARLAALNAQYERSMGRPAPEWLSPKSRATLEKIHQWAKEESPDQRSAR
jgi:hypothetical protein